LGPRSFWYDEEQRLEVPISLTANGTVENVDGKTMS
jgi:hypothetical protein